MEEAVSVVGRWELWWQANRAAAPGGGSQRWVLTLDGYRLACSDLPDAHHAGTGDAS